MGDLGFVYLEFVVSGESSGRYTIRGIACEIVTILVGCKGVE